MPNLRKNRQLYGVLFCGLMPSSLDRKRGGRHANDHADRRMFVRSLSDRGSRDRPLARCQSGDALQLLRPDELLRWRDPGCRPDRRRQRQPVRHDTSSAGRTAWHGTVFEITKTASGYATTPTTLVSFNARQRLLAHGANPFAGLIADANGDLFGTTAAGGANGNGLGTVFEIAKTRQRLRQHPDHPGQLLTAQRCSMARIRPA